MGATGKKSHGIGSALLVHGVIAMLAVLGIGSAQQIVSSAQPLAVRLIEEKPALPRPQPKQPRPTPTPRPQIRQPAPVLTAPVAAVPSSFSVAEQPVAQPAPAALPAPPVPAAEAVTEARFDADYLSNPKPPYPLASRRLGETGTVYLRVHVGEDGRALKVELKKSSGYERLDRSAQETVEHWRFVPARRGPTPVVSWVVVPVVFSIS